ncbi:MAG: FtsX-like permease family protein [Gloeomargaritaceae cyanobacterium C42_A2020_066]|nr:FtsX-like permease family protein [Gloeomargaritaceae cyanobacterium C42_A2020_066]
MGIPLAWLQLSRERVRLLVAVAGITFADVLMFVQLGFRDALFDAAVAVQERIQADLVLVSPLSEALFAMKKFPRRRLYQAQSLPEVASINPMYVDLLVWRNPETGKTRSILAMGFNPERSILAIPEVEANLDQIRKADVVLFDRNSRAEFGPVPQWFDQGKTVQTELNGRRVTVGGLFSLGASFSADGNVITSDLNFLRMAAGRQPGEIDVGLITLKPGADLAAVQAKLQAILPSDTQVLTHEEFVDLEREYWANSTAIGFIFGLGVVMGFAVGTVIVYQILYTDVSDHLAEYATLKAMGYGDLYLLGVVFQEALILAVVGFIPGYLLSTGMYVFTQQATLLPIGMTLARASTVFGLTVLMCFISGAVAVRRLGAADPADIF